MTTYRNTFFIVLGTIFLLPLFFIPGGALDLTSAKSLLIVLGIAIGALVFLFETWKAKELVLPKSALIVVVALLPLIYFLSALLSTPSSLSLLGYNFEVGTFAFILLGSALLVTSAVVFGDTGRTLQAVLATFAALTLVVLISLVKIIWPNNFFGESIGNPMGIWTDLGVVLPLLSVLSILILGMLPMRRTFKLIFYGVFALSIALAAIINFETANVLSLVFAILLFLYFVKLEKKEKGAKTKKAKADDVWFLPVILAIVSLTLLVNPMNLGEKISKFSNVTNSEVRPTLSTTLGISKSVLTQSGLFGSGPNTFSRDWLLYKPQEVNATPFWGVAFPYGAGFIPTQIAATGIIGTALWIAFLVLVLGLVLKALANLPNSIAERFALVTTLVSTILLWTGAFLYTPSSVLLMLAFALTGIFVAMCCEAGIITLKTFNLKETTTKVTTGAIFAGITIGAVVLLYTGGEKAIAQYHFQKALNLANKSEANLLIIEKEVESAIKLAPLDSYLLALSQINFVKAQTAANAATGKPADNRKVFEESLAKSVQAAKAAVATNPENFANWLYLGNIYAALVPAPLSVSGAYENAKLAYTEAFKRNPSNPEIPLLFAYLEISRNNLADARLYIMSSLALKDDYTQARNLLEQLNNFEKANGK